MAEPTPDLLSAASLALAGLAVLFGLWSADLKAVASLPKKGHLADRGPAIRHLKAAQWSKAVPLATGCLLTATVLAPPALRVATSALNELTRRGSDALVDYDAGQALFIVVWVLIVGLAASTSRTAWQLRMQIKDYQSPP